MRPTRSCCLQHGRWKKGRAQQGICMIAHDWPLMCARHLWPGTFGVRIRSVPTKMTASRFLSPFISLLIAVTHPEHAREQKHPHWGWGLLLAMWMLGNSFPQPLWEWRGEWGPPGVGHSLWWQRGPSQASDQTLWLESPRASHRGLGITQRPLCGDRARDRPRAGGRRGRMH